MRDDSRFYKPENYYIQQSIGRGLGLFIQESNSRF